MIKRRQDYYISVLMFLIVAAAGPVVAQDTTTARVRFEGAPPPPEMERLAFLLGRWDNRTEFLDTDGNVISTFHLSEDMLGAEAGYTIRQALGGWTLEGGGNAEFGRSWYRYDPTAGRYKLLATDFFGNLDILEGQFEGQQLVLTEPESEPHPDGGTIRWRWIFSDIGDEAYQIRQLMSRDEGRSWVLVNRQQQMRLPDLEPVSAIGQNFMEELTRWLGSWESEPEATDDGRTFRFRYDLRSYDPGQTLIAYTISQIFEDGEERLLWEGTKGYDPVRRVTFSNQRSPAGLAGRGVYSSGPGGSLIVHGQGFSPQGAGPPLRDVFQPLSDGSGFRTSTLLFRDGEWQEVRTDTWRTAAGIPTNSTQAKPMVADSLRPTAAISRLVGTWEITPFNQPQPTGRLEVRWLPGGQALQKQMTVLQGQNAGPRAHGIIGFDPIDEQIRGVDFQSMIWGEDRLVHLMFVSEYWVQENAIRRIYSVHYPSGEPLMPLPHRGGNLRTYRETYTFVDDDSIDWTTEIDDGGEWKPFGGAGRGSTLRRVSGNAG